MWQLLLKTMQNFIICPNIDGGISILMPTGVFSVEETARRDLPPSTPYKIILESDLPGDSDFRDAWDADFSSPDGYAIGYEAWNLEQSIQQ